MKFGAFPPSTPVLPRAAIQSRLLRSSPLSNVHTATGSSSSSSISNAELESSAPWDLMAAQDQTGCTSFEPTTTSPFDTLATDINSLSSPVFANWDPAAFAHPGPLLSAHSQPSVPSLSHADTNAAAPQQTMNPFSFAAYSALPDTTSAPLQDPASTASEGLTIAPQMLTLAQPAEVQPFSRSPSLAPPTNKDDSDLEMSEDEDVYEDDEDDEGDESYKDRSRASRHSGLPNPARRLSKGTSSGSSVNGSTSSTTAKRSAKANSASAASNTVPEGSRPLPPTITKKRGGARVTVAEFIPPDVSGLSKREARLVKNRAAAFLSRQRKREEFESMEGRLAQVMEENARLKEMKGGNTSSTSTAEVERLQEMLQEAQRREQALQQQLEAERARAAAEKEQAQQAQAAAAIKLEPELLEQAFRIPGALDHISAPRQPKESSMLVSTKEQGRHTGPGFSLMALVFSLTLLSMPHQHQLQASMNRGGAQPTRISYAPTGTSGPTLPPVFDSVLERWDGVETTEVVESREDEDDMEVELEPWNEETDSTRSAKASGSSYVVDFEMPVIADPTHTDEDGKIRVRLQPCGVPRPRQSSGILKPGEIAWDGTPLPPLPDSGLDIGSPDFVQNWDTWGGWKEFLNDDLVGMIDPRESLVDTSIAEAMSPASEPDHSVVSGGYDEGSERWMTPPPFATGDSRQQSPTPAESATPTQASSLASALAQAPTDGRPVDVNVALSTLPPWSRALLRAVAGEKIRAKVKVSRRPRAGVRSKNSVAASKRRVGLTVKV